MAAVNMLPIRADASACGSRLPAGSRLLSHRHQPGDTHGLGCRAGVPDWITAATPRPSSTPAKCQAHMPPRCVAFCSFIPRRTCVGSFFTRDARKQMSRQNPTRGQTDSKSQMASTVSAAVSVKSLPPDAKGWLPSVPNLLNIKPSLLDQVTLHPRAFSPAPSLPPSD